MAGTKTTNPPATYERPTTRREFDNLAKKMRLIMNRAAKHSKAHLAAISEVYEMQEAAVGTTQADDDADQFIDVTDYGGGGITLDELTKWLAKHGLDRDALPAK